MQRPPSRLIGYPFQRINQAAASAASAAAAFRALEISRFSF